MARLGKLFRDKKKLRMLYFLGLYWIFGGGIKQLFIAGFFHFNFFNFFFSSGPNLIFMGDFFHAFALQASLTSLTCPGTLALLDHHFLDHSFVSPEHTLTNMDLVLYKALGGAADEKEAGLVGLQRWKRQISSRLDGGGLQGLKGDQVTLKDVMETINKDKPNKMKLNKTCENVSFHLRRVFCSNKRSIMASSFSEC